MDKTGTTTANSGAKSSATARLDLIPHRALVALASRFQLGAERYGYGNWRKGLQDTEYVCERLAHVMNHAALLIEKLRGDRPWDRDDDAAAIMWGGAFASEAVFAIRSEEDDLASILKAIDESAK